MKQYVVAEVKEVQGEGFEAFAGKSILIFSMNYIYTGILDGINDSFLRLKDGKIVYETGAFTDKKHKDAQRVPGEFLYIQRSAVEAFSAGQE